MIKLRSFNNSSVSNKLRLMLITAIASALVIASLAISVFQVFTSYNAMLAHVGVVADMAAKNSDAALIFDDVKGAEAVLSSLQAEPGINLAVISTSDGKPFAVYGAGAENTAIVSEIGGDPWLRAILQSPLAQFKLSWQYLESACPISSGSDAPGVLYLRANLKRLYTQALWNVFVTLSVILCAARLAFYFSRRLEQRISQPIIALANTISRVSEEQDYSLRTEAGEEDEIGQLISGFNAMLSQVEDRDKRLEEYRTGLEEQVAMRTAELSRINIELRAALTQATEAKEIADRANMTNIRMLNREQNRSELLEKLAKNESLGAILDKLSLDVESELAGSLCSVLLLDAQGKRLLHGAAPSLPAFYNDAVHGMAIGPGIGSCGSCAYTGQRVIVEDVRTHPYWKPFVEFANKAGLVACWSEPIFDSNNKLLGTFAIYHRSPCLPDDNALASIKWASSFAGVAIQRKQDEKQQQQLVSIIEATPDFVGYADAKSTRLMFINGAGRNMTGLGKTDEVSRLKIDDIQPSWVRRQFSEEIIPAAIRDGSWIGESAFINVLDGREIPVLMVLNAHKSANGEAETFSTISRDITGRKKAETELIKAKELAEQANIAKSQFLANMSHEIRTPMNGVMGMTELLLDTALTDEQDSYAKMLLQSGRALLAVINDILDFSKIEAGKMELESTDTDLTELVADVIELYAKPAHGKGLELNGLVGSDVPAWFRCDPVRLRQILSNLISNAVKFTPAGEVSVRVALLERSGGSALLRFEIKDTGIGVLPDKQMEIFSAFAQADASTTRRFGGTGLGLAIAKELTSLMDGEIGVASEPGQGSTFWFTVRLNLARAPVPFHSLSRKNLSGIKLLIISGHPGNRCVLLQYAKAWGMLVDAVDTGYQGLAGLRLAVGNGMPYALVLLDVAMQETDGLAIVRQIKADPALADLHIGTLVSVSQTHIGREALSLGVDFYLNKPVRQSRLYDCLLHAVETGAAGISHVDGASAKSNGLGLNILVAEDSEANQALAVAMLRRLGCKAVVAENGEEAVKAIENQRFDLVLMDCQMPVMDGYEASIFIRELEAGQAESLGRDGTRLPIIALTAHAMEGDRMKCLQAGMDDYLTKPYTRESLQAIIERWAKSPANSQFVDSDSQGEDMTAKDPLFDTELPAVDFNAIETLQELQISGEEDIISKLLHIYLNTTPVKLTALVQAAAAGDAKSLHKHAHDIKSTSAQYGAHPLSSIAARLECLARTGDISCAKNLINDMQGCFAVVDQQLRQYLASHTAISPGPVPRPVESAPENIGLPTVAYVKTASEASSPPSPMREKPLILVVDDEESLLYLIKELLTPAGFQVECASSGEDALALLPGLKPDLIMLDMMMTGMDGIAACAAIKQLPEFSLVPIVLVTGRSDIAAIEQAYQAGAADFFIKPVNFTLLEKRLRYLIRDAELLKELKTTEEVLSRSEERWKFALEGAGDGVWDYNLQTHEVVYSKRYQEMYGLADGEKHEWKQCIHREDFPGLMEKLQDYLSGKVSTFSYEYRMLDKDGDYKWILDRAMLVSRTADGKPLRMIGTHSDITKRKQQEIELQTILLASVDGFCLVSSAGGRFLEVNPSYCEMVGYERNELLHMCINDLDVVETADETRQHMTAIMEGRDRRFKTVQRHKDGRLLDVEVSARFLDIQGGIFVAFIRDITQENRARVKLELAAKVFDSCGEAIVVTDHNNNIVSVNSAFSEITGFSKEEVIGSNPSMFKSGRHDQAFYRKMWDAIIKTGQWQGEIWDRRRNGEIYPKWVVISKIEREGEIANYVAVFSDITKRKANEEYIQKLAHYDVLTGLPNRLLFQSRLDQALASAKRNQNTVALMFIDLDRFKYINDAFGHETGDQLLIAVAQRLKLSLRESDTAARLGGDEFVVILENSDRDYAELVAQKLLAALSPPHALGSHVLVSTPSIGVALYPRDGLGAEELINHADAAMYCAKEKGRNAYEFYKKELAIQSQDRAELEADLRVALERKQFLLFYQPKLDVATGRITGMEALVRWQHPGKGLIQPDRFIPVAEETGLIALIGEWVLRTACFQAMAWQRQGLGRLRVAVNVSIRQLQKLDFAAQVLGILEETGLPPNCLELELTESMLMKNIEHTCKVLHDLKALGVFIVVDDFGTAYSCLDYIKRLPIDILKIDQSFVRDISIDSHDRALIQAMIAVASSLKLEIVAEGVETLEQEDFLMLQNCHTMQGYLLGRPVSAEQFEGLIKERLNNP